MVRTAWDSFNGATLIQRGILAVKRCKPVCVGDASMGPRLFSVEYGRYAVRTVCVSKASMGPRLFSVEYQVAMSHLTALNRFNGATLIQRGIRTGVLLAVS